VATFPENGMITFDHNYSGTIRTVLSCAIFNLGSVEYACFLKCDADGGSKIMKSEYVSLQAPQALSWDWRKKWD